MSYHSFSLDPRTVLGVAPDAPSDEIHEAYRSKSKKHHPDVGGDDWAFRIVARAYEVLTTTTEMLAREPWRKSAAQNAAHWQAPHWTGRGPFARADSAWTSARNGETRPEDYRHEGWQARSSEADSRSAAPDALRSVAMELIWTRFETDIPVLAGLGREAGDSTLSVCLVVSWPPRDLVERAAEFPSTAETLHKLIDIFKTVRSRKGVSSARSQIEDGRFVGWLCFADVVTAEGAFHSFRGKLRTRGLTVALQTRDLRVPFDTP
jgi:DnaJ domain